MYIALNLGFLAWSWFCGEQLIVQEFRNHQAINKGAFVWLYEDSANATSGPGSMQGPFHARRRAFQQCLSPLEGRVDSWLLMQGAVNLASCRHGSGESLSHFSRILVKDFDISVAGECDAKILC